MNVINIRTLQRNMKEITEKVKNGESFAVYKNSTFVFQINPPVLVVPQANKKIETLHDVFKSAQFSLEGGLIDINKKIDNIVYKI